MPELPEVETIVRGLGEWIIDKTIQSVDYDVFKIFPNDKQLVDCYMIDAQITAVNRRGKVIMISLDSSYQLVIHLKMTGQMIYVGEDQVGSLDESLPNKSTRITIRFTDGTHLFYNDQRKFGWMKLLTVSETKRLPLLAKMGPEPLSAAFTCRYFYDVLERRSNTSIKGAILDQQIVAGIGNIYADESLFVAGIHPNRKCRDLTEHEIRRLHRSIRKILRKAIGMGGSSRQNYRNAIGQKGDYLNQAFVYGRAGEPCIQCGRLIEKSKVAGRGTHVCSQCQKN